MSETAGKTITQAGLDGQKIKYHTDVLEKWLAGEEIWPLYFEVGPTAVCNNRCVFCAYSYLDHKPSFLAADRLAEAIGSLADHGARSCMFAGEGEPLLHPDLADFVELATDRGIDAAVTSNLLAADEELLKRILPRLQWIRCSLNATDAEEYRLIHKGPRDGFDRVWDNLRRAVTIRDARQLPVTVGVQCIVMAENQGGLAAMAGRLAEMGVDYFSLKPCIAHPQMEYQPVAIGDEQWDELVDQVRAAAGNRLTVIARQASREGTTCSDRGYRHCLALPFFAEIISDGRVFSCGPMLGDERFCYGNINEQSFEDIWQGKRRGEICRHAAEELDVNTCMPSCRLHQVNAFLWQLKHPPAHVNFI